MTITAELQSLEPSALVELYVLDLTPKGGDLVYFHAGTNALGADVTWQGKQYTRMPIDATGFSKSGSGTLPRPVLSISNTNGLVGATARAYGDFLGCKLTRKRTFARFMDAVNFPSGNPEADPNQHLPDEEWYIDRKASENPVSMSFEMVSALDLIGVMIPRRQFIQNCCSWTYRSAECGYAGVANFDVNDLPVSDRTKDVCSKSLAGCKKRFSGNLPFGGFPGCGLVR